MQFRTLGRTGIKISEIGLGCWGMGGSWGPLDDTAAILAIQKAVELGVNFLDTALAYGAGHSEGIVAKALEKTPHPVTVATKIPPKNHEWPASPQSKIEDVFPKDWIIECTEKSLKTLRQECLDLQQFHVWARTWDKEDAWKETIQTLKKQGKIRFFGISINDHEPDSVLKTLESGLVDTVQVIYNIFDQSPEKNLFPYCLKNKIGVIARVPLDEGGLSGQFNPQTKFHPDDWRADYFKGENLIETCHRAARLKFLIRDEIKTLAQGALKFCLSHPEVSTVIAGMRKSSHVEENCAASDGKLLRKEELLQLKNHAWRRRF